MSTNNAVNTSLSGQTGTGSFAGSISPTLITPIIAQINDVNGNDILSFGPVVSAVNYLTIANNASGSAPGIASFGADSEIGLFLSPKNNNISLIDSTETIAPSMLFFNAAGTHFTGLRAAVAQSTNVTFILPSADGTSNGIMQTDGSGNLSFSSVPYPKVSGWTNFTPTITLVGGSGNTVPTFSSTSARYTQVGNIVFIEVALLNSSGGTAGAGTGVVNIALPITSGSSVILNNWTASGFSTNNTTTNLLYVSLPSVSATTCTLTIQDSISTVTSLTGNGLNNAVRQITFKFSYEV